MVYRLVSLEVFIPEGLQACFLEVRILKELASGDGRRVGSAEMRMTAVFPPVKKLVRLPDLPGATSAGVRIVPRSLTLRKSFPGELEAAFSGGGVRKSRGNR